MVQRYSALLLCLVTITSQAFVFEFSNHTSQPITGVLEWQGFSKTSRKVHKLFEVLPGFRVRVEWDHNARRIYIDPRDRQHPSDYALWQGSILNKTA